MVISAMVLLFVSFLSLIGYIWFHNFSMREIRYDQLESYTINGNPYTHDTVSGVLENGNLTGLYICESELIREWNRVSKIDYFKTDLKGQPLRTTLIRYLSSKGLRKDSLSFHSLSAADIGNIEKGLANFQFRIHPGIYQRIYETLFDIHVYVRSGFVEHHSFGQRLAFATESLKVFKKNPLTGTGPGDVYSSLHAQAGIDNIVADANWEGKPHNQFANFLIAFGLPGLIWILFCWFYPALKYGYDPVFQLFFLIILISMLVMDSLESYSTMVFFASLYSLLIFGKPENQPEISGS